MDSNAILHEVRQLYNVSDRLDSLADLGPARMADREVLYEDDSADSRVNVSVRYRSKNLGFTLVRWAHPRGLPPASEALARPSAVGGR